MRRGGGIHRWILAGLAAGLVAGLAANLTTASSPEARAALRSVVEQVLAPLGGIFLRLLFLTVLPLVFSCLALGVRELGNPRELGKIGLKTLVFTLILSGTSVAIGLGAVNLIRPGDNITSEARQSLLENARKESTAVATKAAQGDERPRLERLVHAVIPRNPVESAARAFDGDMLAVMCFALLFGVALAACGSERTGALVAFLEGLYDVSMWLVGFALTLAPVGVALLVFSMSSLLGTQIIVTLGAYVATVLAGLILQQFVVYPLILKFACGVSPRRFFSEIRPVMVTAFSTSSSNATLPTTLHVAQTRLGIPPRIANFVLTLGSTFNQNGTALFEGVTVIFLAQFYGVHLSLDQQLQVVGMAILAGVGTAGVPGGSIPLIVPVLISVGVPGEGIVVILGVDRLLDMCRTVLNVTGDMVAAEFVSRGAKEAPPGPGP